MSDRPKLLRLEFPVMMLYGDGSESEAQAFADVTEEEYELLLRCCREGRSLTREEGLQRVVYLAENYVVYSLSLYSANDNIGMPGGLDNLSLEVRMPRRIQEIVERERSGE